MMRPCVLAVMMAGLVAHAPAARAQTFELVDLGTPLGTTASSARAINDSGTVVGMADAGRLFVWNQATGIQDLTAPFTLPNQDPRLNAAGQIVGLWQRGGTTYPFLWDTGTFQELAQPAPGWVQYVERLTDGGIALFRGPNSAGDCPVQSALLYQGALYDVSSALGACWDPRDVDDSPRIAGSIRITTLFSAFESAVWSPAGVERLSRRLPPGQGVLVPDTYQRIGAGGHLAGQQGNQASRLFVIGPANDYFQVDSPIGGSFFAAAVNRQGDVVANAQTSSLVTPFLIRNRRLIDLSTVVNGYRLIYVWDMNRHGHIAGMAVRSNGDVRAVVLKPADQPRALQATGSGSQITLAWTPPPGAPAGSTYLLQVGSTSGAANLFSASVGAVTSISGNVPNGTYYARVTMVYPDGAWSGVSNEVTIAVPSPPPAPTNLSHVLSGRRLTLSWTSAAGAATYVLEAGSQSGGRDLFTGNIGAAASVSGDVPPGTYYVRVRAVSAGGTVSPVSNEIVVTVP